mgnify:CR=1 FL=1
MLEDSRCPKDATSVWAGRAKILVEISSEDANFQKPSWVGPEVSDETKYYNYKLVNHPYSKWNETKKKL